jgi:hypothetical protein
MGLGDRPHATRERILPTEPIHPVTAVLARWRSIHEGEP